MVTKDSGAALALQHLGRCAAVYEEEKRAKPPEPWGLGFVIGFLTAHNLSAESCQPEGPERDLADMERLARRYWHQDIEVGWLIVSYQRRGPGLTYWDSSDADPGWKSLTREQSLVLLAEKASK